MSKINLALSYSASTNLLRRVQRHDSAAWERIVDIYAPFVYRWSRKFGLQPADAEDAVGEVFAALLNDIARFEKDGRPNSFRRWLSTVCYHVSLRIRSKQKSALNAAGGTTANLQFAGLALPADYERQLMARDELDWLQQQVMTVLEREFNPSHWRAFWLTVIEGRQPADVGRTLGLSVWSVYKARATVLSRLRSELGEDWEPA